MRGLIELYIAYTIVWLGLFGYMAYLHWRQIKLRKDIKNLEEMMMRHAERK